MDTTWKWKLLVASIDFGTTYSGFAISFLSDYKENEAKILTHRWQPGDRPPTYKTPTCLLLKPDNSFHSFGYEAEKKYAELAEDQEHKEWKYFRRFKMKLYKANNRNVSGLSQQSKIKDEEGRDIEAMTVFSYSIEYMKKKITEVVQEKVPNIREDDIYFVLTVPAIWSEQAKKFMSKAALNARIPKERLRLALEPECAAVYVLHTMSKDKNVMRPGSSHVIIDLGGGTLDIAALRVSEYGLFEEIIVPEGGAWGGDNVNLKFEQLLLKITGGPAFAKFKDENMEDFLNLQRTFEHRKCAFFDEGDDGKVTLQIPQSFQEIHMQCNCETLSQSVRGTTFADKIEMIKEKMRLKTNLFRSLFTETVDGILVTVENVIMNVPDKIETIICVGGFSDCGILKKAFRDKFPHRTVIIPQEAVTAIMKGAIIFGRDHSIVDKRISRYTYGLDWNEDFDSSIHDPKKREETEDGTLCRDIFRKLIGKGEPVQCGIPTKEIKAYVKSRYQTEIEFPFYRSEIKECPKYIDEIGCYHMGTMKVRLGVISQLSLDSCVKLKVYFGATELKAEAVDDIGNKYEVTFNLEETEV